jgi:spore maturation protein CgeB
MTRPLRIVILGLSITSSWGNSHATTYRPLVRELVRHGHQVLFLERSQPWQTGRRDLPQPPYGRTAVYGGLDELHQRYAGPVRDADLVIVGSLVPEGACVGDWVQSEGGGVRAFYDIDTPLTLARLNNRLHSYLRPDQVEGYDLYLSFTGGPMLGQLEREFGARRARVLYGSVDPEQYFPEPQPFTWDLGYMGTYSADRQLRIDQMLLEPARHRPHARFVLAGPHYRERSAWPHNVEYRAHLPPSEHRAFYNRQRFTLNVTRSEMRQAGWSPSVRLFEAAACGTPIISERWPGLDSLLEPGREILLANTGAEVLSLLRDVGEEERRALARRARQRILSEHTAAHRAEQLERYVLELLRTEDAPAAAAHAGKLRRDPVHLEAAP